MSNVPDAVLQTLWRFVRGDMHVAAFEQWAYAEASLEQELGAELYLTTVSTDFRNMDAVSSLRTALAEHARKRWPTACRCVRFRDFDVVDMGSFQAPAPAFERNREWSHEDVFRSFDRVGSCGGPYWWLWAARCRACDQGWLVGSEERQNDVYCLRRMSEAELEAIRTRDPGPPDFDAYEGLLQMGVAASRSVRFLNPADSSLMTTLTDLARHRPGISVSELVALLNLIGSASTDAGRSPCARSPARRGTPTPHPRLLLPHLPSRPASGEAR